MTGKEIVRAALVKSGISQMKLSEILGYSKRTSVGSILNKNNSLRTDVFVRWLDALGYEVIIRNKNINGEEYILIVEPETEEEKQAESDRLKAENAAAIRAEMKPPEKAAGR